MTDAEPMYDSTLQDAMEMASSDDQDDYLEDTTSVTGDHVSDDCLPRIYSLTVGRARTVTSTSMTMTTMVLSWMMRRKMTPGTTMIATLAQNANALERMLLRAS